MKIFNLMRIRLLSFFRHNAGVSAIEFALVLPVLLFVFMAAVETSNYVYMNQKLKNAAFNVMHLVNMQDQISEADLNAIGSLVRSIVEPYQLGANDYYIVFTALNKDVSADPNDKPYVRWQHIPNPSVEADFASSEFDFDRTIPRKTNLFLASAVNGYAFQNGDQLTVVELFYNYTSLVNVPLISDLANSFVGLMSYKVMARPRKQRFGLDPWEVH